MPDGHRDYRISLAPAATTLTVASFQMTVRNSNRETVDIAFALVAVRFIIEVNKIDVVDYSGSCFNAISGKVKAWVEEIGFITANVCVVLFLLFFGLLGDNDGLV